MKDIRTVAAQIFQRGTQAALDLQFEVGRIKFCLFDIIFWGGKYTLPIEYHARFYAGCIASLKLIYQTKRLAKNHGPINRKSERRRHEEEFRFVDDVEWINLPLEAAKKLVMKRSGRVWFCATETSGQLPPGRRSARKSAVAISETDSGR